LFLFDWILCKQIFKKKVNLYLEIIGVLFDKRIFPYHGSGTYYLSVAITCITRVIAVVLVDHSPKKFTCTYYEMYFYFSQVLKFKYFFNIK